MIASSIVVLVQLSVGVIWPKLEFNSLLLFLQHCGVLVGARHTGGARSTDIFNYPNWKKIIQVPGKAKGLMLGSSYRLNTGGYVRDICRTQAATYMF